MYQIELAIENVLQFEKNKTGVGAIAMLDENKKINFRFTGNLNEGYAEAWGLRTTQEDVFLHHQKIFR